MTEGEGERMGRFPQAWLCEDGSGRCGDGLVPGSADGADDAVPVIEFAYSSLVSIRLRKVFQGYMGSAGVSALLNRAFACRRCMSRWAGPWEVVGAIVPLEVEAGLIGDNLCVTWTCVTPIRSWWAFAGVSIRRVPDFGQYQFRSTSRGTRFILGDPGRAGSTAKSGGR